MKRPLAGPRWQLAGLIVSLFALSACSQDSPQPTVSGNLQVWRTLTLDLEGPASSETADINPFSDYGLEVTFSNGDNSYTVPGYFAACGDAAVSGCSEGSIWRAHFTPDAAGTWGYEISFVTGADAAIGGDGTLIDGWHGVTGSVDIAAAGDPADDPRDRGRLVYDGSRYLKHAVTGELFFKAGADAPENMLAYDDFDATPNVGYRRKDWAPHLADAEGVDLEKYGWNGKGAGILGAIAYLADEDMNAFSFLTFNIAGDDMNVFPHLLKGSVEDYEALDSSKEGREQQWTDGVHHDRFDVSKLDQWQRVLSYGNDRGMFLHFKTQEHEVDHLMDGGATGRERLLYVRELVARFGHFLALNWNIGEENDQPPENQIANLAAFAKFDPYNHLRVMHTFPGQKERYEPLLGDASALTGASLQGGGQAMADVRPDVIEWVEKSAAAGKPWVIAVDEPGSAQEGVPVDDAYPDADLPSERQVPDQRRHIRKNALWGVLTAGGTGVEYYYGYQTGCSDLDCEDHRTRATKWADARAALAFFRKHVGDNALSMLALDEATPRPDDYVFTDGSTLFVIYAPDGAGGDLAARSLAGDYKVSWYDPTAGGNLQATNTVTATDGTLALGSSPSGRDDDWVILVSQAAE